MATLNGMLAEAQARIYGLCYAKAGNHPAWAQHAWALNQDCQQMFQKFAIAAGKALAKSTTVTAIQAADLDAVPDQTDALKIVTEALKKAGFKPSKSMSWKADQGSKGEWNVAVKISW